MQATPDTPILVTFLMRCPQHNLHSIERLYETVRNNLPKNIQSRTIHAKTNSSAWIIPMLLDAWSVSRHQTDINHVTGGTHFLTFFLKKSRAILTIHDLRNLEKLSGIRRAIYKLLWFTIPLRRCAAVVVISESTKQALIKQFSIDQSKIFIIPNTVPDLRMQTNFTKDFRNTVLLMGTRPPKNLPRQLEALAKLSDIKPNILLIGELTKKQKALIDQLNLKVDNRYNISNQELTECYRTADLLLFASTEEGFGMPIIEAQSLRLPVITSISSSMPEVAGDGALLVNPYSVEDIANAARTLLSNPSLRHEIANKGTANCKRFSATTVGKRYADLYQHIAECAD